jgi:hypothetical protein
MTVTQKQISNALNHHGNECNGQTEDGRYVLYLMALPDSKAGRQKLYDIADAIGCEYKPCDHGCYYYITLEQAQANGLSEADLEDLS